MNKEELKQTVVNLMYDLHAFQLLNERIVRLLGIHFELDAFALCREHGITYNIL
jgi:hypothetical protein